MGCVWFAGTSQGGGTMRQKPIIAAVIVILIVVAVGYYSYSDRYRNITADIDSVDKYTGGAATTTRVKTVLALNKQVSAFDIHVETSNNNVTLSGQVPTDNDRRVAEEIVRRTEGVATVVNNLKVDPKVQAASAER
jgi:osmotically-inducible protein OsmY